MDTNERREHRSHGYGRLTQILGKDGSRKTEDRRPKWNADPPMGGQVTRILNPQMDANGTPMNAENADHTDMAE